MEVDRSGLDAHARAFVLEQEAVDAPPLNTCRAEDVRDDINEMLLGFAGAAEEVHEVKDLVVPGSREEIRLRVYLPAPGGPWPLLVFLHGGGWVFGDLDVYDSLCRHFTHLVPCAVVSVDYHVSPEAKFPEPLEDCWAAFEWIRSHIAELGGEPNRIAVGGDSAGGNLAAALTFLARNRAPGAIMYQMLIYPVTDISSFDTGSYRAVGEGFFLSRDDMIWFAEAYTHGADERRNPLVSPLLQHDLHGLPPAYVVTCGYDPLRDEGQEYAKRLRQAGVGVTEVCYDDQIHGFIAFGGVIPAAPAAIAAAATAVRDAL